MKFSELWIRKFLNLENTNTRKLLKILNKSNLEVNEIIEISKNIKKAITGKIINYILYNKNEYQLIIDIGKYKVIKIKCNLNFKIIKNSVIILIFKCLKKNINNDEFVFLCSPYNLGISDNKKIIFLSEKIKPGIDAIKLLKLNDKIFDISIPLNRQDCTNIIGISREISILTNTKLIEINTINIKKFNIHSNINNQLINIEDKDICNKYVGRIIKQVSTYSKTPIYIQEKLIKSDFLITNTIDNIINYIFLETGYLINIFNLNSIKNIIIKKTKNNENYINLNKKYILLLKNTLLISDSNNKLLYIPGINCLNKKIFKFNRNDIFIGCGSFNNNLIINNNKIYYKNNKFNKINEYEVDPDNLEDIINYTTNIILNICNGYSGNLIKDNLDKNILNKKINLNIKNIYKKLGFRISLYIIENILIKLKYLIYLKNKKSIIIIIPNYRLDLNIEEDLIEEIIKIYGYNKIPNNKLYLKLNFYPKIVKKNDLFDINKIKNYLVNKGFNEIISYSIINEKDQSFIYKNNNTIKIKNPISKNMSVIRTSLLIGLINSIKFNQDRQINNMKLFENGFCFTIDKNKNIVDNNLLSGVLYGYKKDDFLKLKSNKLFDLYDIKGNLEDILLFLMNKEDFFFKKKEIKLFNKDEGLIIINNENKPIGFLGYINKYIKEKFKLKNNIIFFELNLNLIKSKKTKKINNICLLPINKRDISIFIKDKKNIEDIIYISYKIKDNQIIKLNLIDFYENKENNFNTISFTIRFYIQNKYRNLLDNEINNIVYNHILKLKSIFNIEIKN